LHILVNIENKAFKLAQVPPKLYGN